MSALSRHTEIPVLVPDWHADVVQLLDEHHLVAWSDMPKRRMQFAVSLGRFLSALRDTEVCMFYGRFITDLDSFCYQLERNLPGPGLERRLDGPAGIASLLRARASFRGRPETKHRFYIWHDADIMLQRDPVLFGQLVDTLSGVAAEAEFTSDDLLLIHRSVYVGGSALDLYSEDASGQFRTWYNDGPPGHDVEPFWQIVTGVERPPFLRYRIDCLSPTDAE